MFGLAITLLYLEDERKYINMKVVSNNKHCSFKNNCFYHLHNILYKYDLLLAFYQVIIALNKKLI